MGYSVINSNFALKMRSMKTEYQNRIIMTLKKLREEKGITQASIAQYLDISAGQLGNIESYKQKHKYTLKQIVMLCEKFDYSVQDLFLQEPNSNGSINEILSKIIEYEDNK